MKASRVLLARLTVMNASLGASGSLTGTVTGAMTGEIGNYAWVRNAKTGDVASHLKHIDGGGSFTVDGLAAQNLHVELWVGKECWYGIAGAEGSGVVLPVRVEVGQNKALAIDTAANCAQPPAAITFTPRMPGAAAPGKSVTRLFGPFVPTSTTPRM